MHSKWALPSVLFFIIIGYRYCLLRTSNCRLKALLFIPSWYRINDNMRFFASLLKLKNRRTDRNTVSICHTSVLIHTCSHNFLLHYSIYGGGCEKSRKAVVSITFLTVLKNATEIDLDFYPTIAYISTIAMDNSFKRDLYIRTEKVEQGKGIMNQIKLLLLVHTHLQISNCYDTFPNRYRKAV